MRGMSSRITNENRIAIYQAIGGPDLDGGPQYVYGATPTYSGCASVQYTETGEDVETIGEVTRVAQVNWYKVFANTNPQAGPRWKIIWVEGSVTHTLFVRSNPPSEAGRGSVWALRAMEYT